MKSEEEIQQAHDILNYLLVDDEFSSEFSRELSGKTKLAMHAAHDALCWVLEHRNNPAFGKNLIKLESLLKKHGVVLVPQSSHTE